MDICIGVHVEDMLAVGPSESSKICCRNLRRTWQCVGSMVTDKPQEFLWSFFVPDTARIQNRSFV